MNPGGIPVRGVVYFLAILAATLIAGSLPLLGAVVGALPWYLRDLALPVASATVLSVIRIEGRPFHLAAHALLRYRAGPRGFAGVRPCAAPGRALAAGGDPAAAGRLRRGDAPAALHRARRGARHDRARAGRAQQGRSGPRRLTLRELPGSRLLSRAR